ADRARTWGGSHLGHPPNPSHVRESTLDEYASFLATTGLPAVYVGYTVGDYMKKDKNAIITIHDISIDRARAKTNARDARPVAIVAAYNEVDVIDEVARDLWAQGCDIVAIDNWSQDGTWEVLKAVAEQQPHSIRIERFPSSGAPVYADWQAILSR